LVGERRSAELVGQLDRRVGQGAGLFDVARFDRRSGQPEQGRLLEVVGGFSQNEDPTSAATMAPACPAHPIAANAQAGPAFVLASGTFPRRR
jgi:hypothetical protein